MFIRTALSMQDVSPGHFQKPVLCYGTAEFGEARCAAVVAVPESESKSVESKSRIPCAFERYPLAYSPQSPSFTWIFFQERGCREMVMKTKIYF
jgi:hypothetical protein